MTAPEHGIPAPATIDATGPGLLSLSGVLLLAAAGIVASLGPRETDEALRTCAGSVRFRPIISDTDIMDMEERACRPG